MAAFDDAKYKALLDDPNEILEVGSARSHGIRKRLRALKGECNFSDVPNTACVPMPDLKYEDQVGVG
jgi:hypothetical protein